MKPRTRKDARGLSSMAGGRFGEIIVFGGDPRDVTQKILALADVRVNGARPWDITVYHEDFYARLLRLGSLGLGEAYMDGWWDCHALDEFFCCILSAGLERLGYAEVPETPWCLEAPRRPRPQLKGA
jgi:hypothetical protein